jgi:endopeptidase La
MEKGDKGYFALFLMRPVEDKKESTEAAKEGGEADGAFASLLKTYYPVGIMCSFRVDGNSVGGNVTVDCHRRIVMHGCDSIEPFPTVRVTHHDDHTLEDFTDADERKEVDALMKGINSTLKEIVHHPDAIARMKTIYTPRDVSLSSPGPLSDYAASLTALTPAAIQQHLATLNVKDRLLSTLTALRDDSATYALQQRITEQADASLTAAHQRIKLKEQRKVIDDMIAKAGGTVSTKDKWIDKFTKRMEGKEASPEIMRVIEEETEKLGTLSSESSEFALTRSYIDWLTALPYSLHTKEKHDLAYASSVLDSDHYGMQDVKDRILEFIATGSLLGNMPKGKILCLVGPPGVGKTSIAQSIAKSLDRKFYRIAVGGLEDVGEIKGHRRTYVGSMPGKLIQALKHTQSNNPVILIDEIDKLGKGHRGDPAAALLEALDPEQNATFMDQYIDAPIDLSHVLFVCTANDSSMIPGPLADRMDFIHLTGYIYEEKLRITKQHLEPTIRQQTGLTPTHISLSDKVIEALIRWYAREPGVRMLSKYVERIYRKVALRVARDKAESVDVNIDNLHDFVGQRRYAADRLYARTPVGVAMGLAANSIGGATVFIEATVAEHTHINSADNSGKSGPKGSPTAIDNDNSAMIHSDAYSNGRGSLLCTGQMGDVMKESTSIAYTNAKRYLSLLSPTSRFFSHKHIHMHIPFGGTPKDGPSAGITMTCSLLSLALRTPLVQDIAMTGELTLTGKVVAIGGVKEKILAAKRANVNHILLPVDNERDWLEVPDYVREGMSVNFVTSFEEVLHHTFPTYAAKLVEQEQLLTPQIDIVIPAIPMVSVPTIDIPAPIISIDIPLSTPVQPSMMTPSKNV